MNQKRTRKKKYSQAKRPSKFFRIVGSTKLTPFLALLAFGSIIYFKVYMVPKKITKKKVKIRSIHSKHQLSGYIGQTRFRGPKLTSQFFQSHDLLLCKGKQKLEVAIISKVDKTVFALPQIGSKQPLLRWIKERGGRFALFRLSPNQRKTLLQKRKALGKSTSLPSKNRMPKQLAIYKKIGLNWPSTEQKSLQTWLKKVASESHYNDLR